MMQKAIPVRRSHRLVCRFWSRDGQAGSYQLVGRISSTDADAWAAITPEEETESLGVVRSQQRRCFPSVDE